MIYWFIAHLDLLAIQCHGSCMTCDLKISLKTTDGTIHEIFNSQCEAFDEDTIRLI